MSYNLNFTVSYENPPAGTSFTLVFGVTPEEVTVAPSKFVFGMNISDNIVGAMKVVENETVTLLRNLSDVLISPSWVISSDKITLNRIITNDPIYPMKYVDSDQLNLGNSVDDVIVHIMNVVASESINVGLNLSNIEVQGGQTYNLPIGISSNGKIMPWGDTENVLDSHKNFPFNDGIIIDNHQSQPWTATIVQDKHMTSSFILDLLYQDNHNHIPWGDFEFKLDYQYFNSFIAKMDYIDKHQIFPFAIFEELYNIEKSIPFLIPGPVDEHHEHKWGGNVPITVDISHLYDRTSDIVNLSHITYWGPKWYQLICQRKYFPFPSGSLTLHFNNEDPNCVIPDVTEDPLNFAEVYDSRCPYEHWHSGKRDRYEEEIVVVPLPELRDTYYMLNTITLRRLPDLTVLDCYTVDIQTDIDSWTWDFAITLPDESYLDLVKPSLSEGELVLIDIEIMINSWVFTCRVESWTESITFGKRSWTIRGRSPSIALAAPYALPGVITNTSDVQGASLIGDILTGSGWSVEWGHGNNITTFSDYLNPSTGWLIPSGVFNVSDKTRMQALQDVVKAIDARILTKPDCDSDKDLIIIPRYSVVPWGWDSETADHEFNSNVCWEISRQYESFPNINAVVVSGQNQGVVVNATRNGTAGDKAASMVTDSLITTSDAGAERAKNILSKEGMWTSHSIKLFSLDNFISPTGDFPGLILPGKLVAITEGTTTWKGQVTSVSIHGSSVSNSKGIEVTQTIGVEEYHG